MQHNVLSLGEDLSSVLNVWLISLVDG